MHLICLAIMDKVKVKFYRTRSGYAISTNVYHGRLCVCVCVCVCLYVCVCVCVCVCVYIYILFKQVGEPEILLLISTIGPNVRFDHSLSKAKHIYIVGLLFLGSARASVLTSRVNIFYLF